MPPRLIAAVTAFAAAPFPGGMNTPQAAPVDALAAHRWHHRLLLVLAPDADDPKLRRQRDIFRDMNTEARDRDLELVEVVGDAPEAATLRRHFDLRPGFHALLIGKDGGAKLASDAPLRRDDLIPAIDAMPMRREEMQRP